MLSRILKQSTIRDLKVYKRININLCYLCLASTSLTGGLCHDCASSLPRINQACPRCSEPNKFGHICGHCLASPPAFSKVIVPFQYITPTKQLIVQFKQGRNAARPMLVHALVEMLRDHEFDFVVPIPYHWKRLLMRGYHPTLHLAQLIGRHFSYPVSQCLIRHQSSISQRGLSRDQRKMNVKNVFRHKASHPVTGKNILLVDDVMTTGATAHEAASTLMQAGAKSVCVACLARTPTQTV